MIAIVEISGKQFKITKSDTLKVPRQNADVKDKLQFTNVMLIDNEGDVKIGTPLVKNAKVTAHIIEHGRDKKVIVFKKKRRKDYKVKRGHRQGYTLIKIDSIAISTPKEKKAEPVKKVETIKPKAKTPVAKKTTSPPKAAPKKTVAAKKTEKE